MPSPAPDTSQWPTQTEAAARLGTNERTIRRWIAAKRLRSARRPVTGRKPVVIINPEDIERLRSERLPAVVIEQRVIEGPGIPVPLPDTNPDTRQPVRIEARDAVVFASLIKALAQAAGAAEPKPWLTLAEAAEYSGLPKSFLIAQGRAGKIRAVNVGTGEREFWRFNRDALSR